MTLGSRDFGCSWEHCGKSFNRRSDLCRHYRTHSNERPYHCTVKSCNKSFIQRSALTVHLRTHTGEKPHICELKGCHRAFADSSSLARHRRIHTGERPFRCRESTCEQSFCRKATLTKHQRLCHPPGLATQSSSDNATIEHFYQASNTLPMPYGQYRIVQQPTYPQSVIPIHECSQQNVLATEARVHGSSQLITANHTQQQYITLIQQQYEQSRSSYILHGFQQPAFPDSPIPEDHPLAVLYNQSYITNF